FGWELPGRTFWGNDQYRYSTNGTEKSPEIASGHNSTYFRELDSRTGRWWAVDPVTFPHQSPYSTFDNNPILWSDPSGAAVENPGQGEGDPEPKKKHYKTGDQIKDQHGGIHERTDDGWSYSRDGRVWFAADDAKQRIYIE